MPTRSALRTEVRRVLNDTNSTFFTDAQLNTWLDMGNSDAIARLGPFDTAQATILTVADEPNYSVADQCIGIREVYLTDTAGKENRLYIIPQDELNEKFGLSWRSDASGKPSTAYQVDYNVVGLYNKPDSANAGLTLRFIYYKSPSAFASDSATPIFMDNLHDCLTWYCASRGYAQLGQTDKSDWALKRYRDMIKEFYGIATRFSDDFKTLGPIDIW